MATSGPQRGRPRRRRRRAAGMARCAARIAGSGTPAASARGKARRGPGGRSRDAAAPRHSASVTAGGGAAPSARCPARQHAVDHAGAQAGARRRGSARAACRPPAPRARPHRGVARGPAHDQRHSRAAGERAAVRGGPSSGCRTSTICDTGRGVRRSAPASSQHRRPASGCHCFGVGPPARMPRPAATIMPASRHPDLLS